LILRACFLKFLKSIRVMQTTRLLSFLMLPAVCCLISCTGDQSKQVQKPSKRAPTARVTPAPDFSGKEAFDYLIAQTDFGPRNPGSSGHRACLDYLVGELEHFADAVNHQEFTHTGSRGEQISLTNIIASFNLPATNRVMLCAHWDTRPWADQDKDPKKREKPIIGANDGASGVAVLLQLAKLMKQSRPPIGVDILLFDGEDLGQKNDLTNFALGSKYFAAHRSPRFNPQYGILLDMIGDEQLEIPKEPNSLRYAPEVVQYVWTTAENLGLNEFTDDTSADIYDDHIPLNEAGIKTIDLIDFNYPDHSNRYWHTSEDTPNKCSPSSLQVVGTLLVHLIYNSSSQ
jgi:glutaminyl-peptide cyclotransferase